MLLLLMVGAFLFSSCTKNPEPFTIRESLLQGTWVRQGTQEYWRYNVDHTGETWDVSEDVQQGEGTRFTWSTKTDQLNLLLKGNMGQVVPYDYTVKSLDLTQMVWEDIYGNTSTFVKQL